MIQGGTTCLGVSERQVAGQKMTSRQGNQFRSLSIEKIVLGKRIVSQLKWTQP